MGHIADAVSARLNEGLAAWTEKLHPRDRRGRFVESFRRYQSSKRHFAERARRDPGIDRLHVTSDAAAIAIEARAQKMLRDFADATPEEFEGLSDGELVEVHNTLQGALSKGGRADRAWDALLGVMTRRGLVR